MSKIDKDMLEQLVLAYRDGNQIPEVMEQMYEIMFPELKKNAQALAANNQLTVNDFESLIQEGFLRGIKNINKVEKPREFTAYIKQAMRNIMLDDAKEYSQRANKDILEDYDSGDDLPGEDFMETVEEDYTDFIPGENMDLEETKAIVREAVRALPEKQSKVVWDYFFKGMSQKDIAKEYNVADSTVRATLNQAKKNLLNALSDYEKEHDVRLHGIFAMPFMSSLLKEMAMPYALDEAAKEGIKAKIFSDLGFADALAGAAEAGSSVAAAGSEISSAATSGAAAGSAGGATAGGAGTAAAKTGLGVLLKRTAAKVAAGVIAVSLVGGGIFYSATHPMFGAPSEEQQYYETIVEEEVEEIALGEDIADKLVVNEEGIWVKFTPKESGFYLFRTKLNSKFDAEAIDFTTFRGEIDEKRIVFTPGTLSSEDIKNKGGYTLQVADDGMLYEGSTYYIRIQYFTDIGITSMRLDTAEREEMPQVPQLEKKSDAIEIKAGDDLAKHLKKGTTWFAFTPEETAAYRFETGDAADWNHKDVIKICTYKRKTTEFDKVGYGVESYVDYGKGVQCLYFLEELGGELLADTTYYFQFELKTDGVFDTLKLERIHETYVDAQEVSEGENFAAHLKKGETWIAFTPENSGMYRLEAPTGKKLRANDFTLMTYQSSTVHYDAVGFGISAVTDPEESIYCMYFTEEIGNQLEGGVTYYLHFNMKADGLFDSIKISSTDETLEDVESKLE